MIKFFKKILPAVFILGLTVFLFRPALAGLLPLPLDALVGSYFPWLDYKWGYAVGVPVKNPALSDVYSQQFPWQSLAADLMRDSQWPLWNPYSFSGYPLLANWQSAPFYPLRLLMLLLGNNLGFTISVVLQVFLSLSFMHLFLRQLKLSALASLVGAVIFSLSGFMITKLEYNLDGQAFLWTPLALYLIEIYFQKKWAIVFPFLSLIVYAIITAGFFQPAFYGLIIIFSYFVGKIIFTSGHDRVRTFIVLVLFLFLGVGLASLQLFPALEFFKFSIRNLDHNITEYKFGLLPLANLAALLAPDFFGNPATNNFWGFMQYQETSGYFSILAIPLLLSLLANRKKDYPTLFFITALAVSLLLAFANPLSRLIYALKIPLISSGYASRWLMVASLSAAVLAALGLDRLKKPEVVSKFIFYTFLALVVAALTTLAFRQLFGADPMLASGETLAPIIDNLNVSLRNVILPFGLVSILWAGSRLTKKTPFLLLALLLVTFDLSRYFIKFTPFTPTRFLNQNLPTFQFLDKHLGFFRVDKESAPLLPANSWIYQRYQSISGYDPLVYLPYASFYKLIIGQIPQSPQELKDGAFNRYLNLENYHSPLIDLAGIKYLLALKRNDTDVFTPAGTKISPRITAKYQRVFEDQTTVVLENKDVFPRVSLYDRFRIIPDHFQAQLATAANFDFTEEIILDQAPKAALRLSAADSASIISYRANVVEIETKTSRSTLLLLTDTFYPGWEVEIDGVKREILLGFGIYRVVEVPPGVHRIVFVYRPQSFFWGLKISFASLVIITISIGFILGSKLKGRWSS